jgi:hypothetical protein
MAFDQVPHLTRPEQIVINDGLQERWETDLGALQFRIERFVLSTQCEMGEIVKEDLARMVKPCYVCDSTYPYTSRIAGVIIIKTSNGGRVVIDRENGAKPAAVHAVLESDAQSSAASEEIDNTKRVSHETRPNKRPQPRSKSCGGLARLISAFDDSRANAFGCDGYILVLPDPYDSPSGGAELSVSTSVSLAVRADLVRPKAGVGDRGDEVLAASVPETAVNEHCDSCARKDEVSGTTECRQRAPMHTEP